MDQDWGRARAVELLGKASSWLDDESRKHRWHTLLARRLGGLATVAGDAASPTTAERILGAASLDVALEREQDELGGGHGRDHQPVEVAR